jgi:hypothetical protein
MVWVGEIKASRHSQNGVAPALSRDSCWTQMANLSVSDTAQEDWAKMKSVFEAMAAGAANQDVSWCAEDRWWQAALIELEQLMQTKRDTMTSRNKPTTNAPNREVLAAYLASHPATHEIWRDPSAAVTAAPPRTAPVDAAQQPRKAVKRSVDASPASVGSGSDASTTSPSRQGSISSFLTRL